MMPTGNRRLASQMMNPMEISLADEVRKTLQAECYGAALALSLTIPDAYGQIAFPEEKKVGKRYMDWYRQYCGYALSSRMGKDPMPAFDALACYKLRCELLHNGDANMETKYLYELDDQGKLMRNDVNLERVSFSLRIGLSSKLGKTWERDDEENAEYSLVVSVEELCLALCDAADRFDRNTETQCRPELRPRIVIDVLRNVTAYRWRSKPLSADEVAE